MACTDLQLRSRHDLQAAERAVVAAIRPVSLNSAPGGFYHIGLPRDLCRSPPSFLVTSRQSDSEGVQRGDELTGRIRRHVVDQNAFWSTVPGVKETLSLESREEAVKMAAQLHILRNGRDWAVSSVLIGRDITQESLRASGDEAAKRSFQGSATGRGSHLTMWFRANPEKRGAATSGSSPSQSSPRVAASERYPPESSESFAKSL